MADDAVTDPAPPRNAVLFSERLLGLHVHCDVSGCSEHALSSGWLLRSSSTWAIGFRCPLHGHDGGVWKREWESLIRDVVEDADTRGGGAEDSREPLTYRPPFAGMRAVRSYARDGCQAILLTGGPPSGFIQIAHVLSVRNAEDPSPLLAVASEVSSLGLAGSHVLGLYADHRHVNCGASDDWADLVRFEERALALAGEHLHLHGAWRLLG